MKSLAYARSVRRSLLLLTTVLALLASTVGTAQAQRVQPLERDVRPIHQVETLRLACAPDFIDGQRGVLCRWSEATNPGTRAYQLYRITDGSARQLVTTVGRDGRLGFFDTDVSAPSQLIYGVITVNQAGRLIGQSEPVRVQFGQHETDIRQLRFACAPDFVEGQRGVLCRWSQAQVDTTRAYLLYRSVGGAERELIAEIPADGRRGFFDTAVVSGAVHTYGVVAVDGSGGIVAASGPQRVQWPTGD